MSLPFKKGWFWLAILALLITIWLAVISISFELDGEQKSKDFSWRLADIQNPQISTLQQALQAESDIFNDKREQAAQDENIKEKIHSWKLVGIVTDGERPKVLLAFQSNMAEKKPDVKAYFTGDLLPGGKVLSEIKKQSIMLKTGDELVELQLFKQVEIENNSRE